MIPEYIAARAEALCNLWGDDPNDDQNWSDAVAHAFLEEKEN